MEKSKSKLAIELEELLGGDGFVGDEVAERFLERIKEENLSPLCR